MADLTDRAGIDTDQAGKINEGALDWLQSVVDQAKGMKLDAKKKVECPECRKQFLIEIFNLEQATKAAANIAKLLDQNARLTQFIQGKEDSRPGGRGGDNTILQCLKPDQLAILQTWLVENQGVGQ
jgi:hypothetical protein